MDGKDFVGPRSAEPLCDINLYTNVSDFTGNRTVPSMDNSNAASPRHTNAASLIHIAKSR